MVILEIRELSFFTGRGGHLFFWGPEFVWVVKRGWGPVFFSGSKGMGDQNFFRVTEGDQNLIIIWVVSLFV